ncbi:MAG TPA: hypothetical protein VFC61_02290 [Blastocatellia bacterium]|nr:hypothetical protein [Blastocatellia bacterium]
MGYVSNASATTIAKTPKGKVTANTGSKTLIADNRDRIRAFVSNNGANDVWLALGTTAVAEEGILLKKEGGGNQPFQLEGYTGIITVITKTGESVVSFSEA